MGKKSGLHIEISGIVQGVGFRPFIFNLAERYSLTGWVRNTSAGVEIEVDGSPNALDSFTKAINSELPSLARIDQFILSKRKPNGYTKFEIFHSQAIADAFQPISPDVSICSECLSEMFNPIDRRYLYPFINCTNCGPRFTIIKDIPYDRPKTTMATFTLCPDCGEEYANPLDRRFHAQPVACPKCGPHIWLETSSLNNKDKFPIDHFGSEVLFKNDPNEINRSSIIKAQELLQQGKILAIKGLGGFHLACDATNADAVLELRRKKLRIDKPFALMMPDIYTVEIHCFIDDAERELLESYFKPIVILKRRPDSPISQEVAPNQNTIGVMLPYTPVHYRLYHDFQTGMEVFAHPNILVMTSGNISEEPIAIDNEEARERLNSLADAFLMNNRPIHMRCDDSVVRVFNSSISKPDNKITSPSVNFLYSIRRSRGYAPNPILLPSEVPSVLATGAELKNTFCLTRGRYAFLSHHIGDLENYETLKSFEQGIRHYERLFRVHPVAIAYDLHPNYLSTQYALERGAKENLPTFGIQHHHAHIAACMADNSLLSNSPVIGVAFDGTGYGDDGAIWGGEFLLADYSGYKRIYHLDYIPLPGGDTAIKFPWRVSLSWLKYLGIDWTEDLPPVKYAWSFKQAKTNLLYTLESQIDYKINTPSTSSMGRLFDAVASLIGIRQETNYEAQAAIELEAIADPNENGYYPFEISNIQNSSLPLYSIKPESVFYSILDDLSKGIAKSIISARFHNSIAKMVLDVCEKIRTQYNSTTVALSGGVWQNITLLEKTTKLLVNQDFDVIIHHSVPTNDGCIALGQAMIASKLIDIKE